jgi:hypothetical protein
MKESLSKDVFLGRGPSCYKNPGNKEYRNLVKLYAADFHRGLQKSEKSKFIDNLKFKLEMQGFRFLSFSDDNKKWESASDWEVKEKIGHDLRDYRHPSSIGGRKTLVTKGKTKYMKMKQMPFRNIWLELNTGINRHPMIQNGLLPVGYHMMNLVHRLNGPINYAMTSTTGFLQNPGFFCYYLAPNHILYRPDIGNQCTDDIKMPQDCDFDNVKIKAANETSVCEDSCISTKSMPDSTLQNSAYDISEGEPSALHECGLE